MSMELIFKNCNSHPKTFVFQTIRFTLKLPKAVNGRIKRPQEFLMRFFINPLNSTGTC